MKKFQIAAKLLIAALVLGTSAGSRDLASDSNIFCKTEAFQQGFRIGGPWQQDIIDPVPVQVLSGLFPESSKAVGVTSTIYCEPSVIDDNDDADHSVFEVHNFTITKGETSYVQNANTDQTGLFGNEFVGGVWYISASVDGKGICGWFFNVTGCYEEAATSAATDDPLTFGLEGIDLEVSDSPSAVPSTVPSSGPSAPSNTRPTLPWIEESSEPPAPTYGFDDDLWDVAGVEEASGDTNNFVTNQMILSVFLLVGLPTLLFH
jgi:hypothetical protein